jgi:hypothetical protein
MDLMVSTDAAVGVSIGPLEGLGRFVVALEVAGNFAGEIGLGCEHARVMRWRWILENQISN